MEDPLGCKGASRAHPLGVKDNDGLIITFSFFALNTGRNFAITFGSDSSLRFDLYDVVP